VERARIEIRPRPDAHAALARRGSWDGPRSWRIVAHTTQADAPRTLAELQAARPAALWEYRTTHAAKNPPAHLHIPPTVAKLGIVLDLTTQTDATRTTWDREVHGLIMCADADAMQARAGTAAIYLLRPERRQNPPATDSRNFRNSINAGIDHPPNSAGKRPTKNTPDENLDAYMQGQRDADAGEPPRPPADPEERRAYAQGYADAQDDKRDQKWEKFWGGPPPTRNAFPKREGVGAGAAQRMSHADALDTIWGTLSATRARRALTAIEAHDADSLRDLRDEMQRAGELTADERAAWQVVITDAHTQQRREPNAHARPYQPAPGSMALQDAIDHLTGRLTPAAARSMREAIQRGDTAQIHHMHAPDRDPKTSEAMAVIYAATDRIAMREPNTSQAQADTIPVWINADGADRVAGTTIRLYDPPRWEATGNDGTPIGVFKRRIDAADAVLEWFAKGRKILHGTQGPFIATRQRNSHEQTAEADAGATYEAWHDRAPRTVTELDNLPDVIGVYIGRATRIGYRSDKWHARGQTQDYDHDYTEPGYVAPEVWADRADLAHATAIVIVGGNQRITPEGID